MQCPTCALCPVFGLTAGKTATSDCSDKLVTIPEKAASMQSKNESRSQRDSYIVYSSIGRAEMSDKISDSGSNPLALLPRRWFIRLNPYR